MSFFFPKFFFSAECYLVCQHFDNLFCRGPRKGPPTASSLAQMLIQALHSEDNALMEVSLLFSTTKC